MTVVFEPRLTMADGRIMTLKRCKLKKEAEALMKEYDFVEAEIATVYVKGGEELA